MLRLFSDIFQHGILKTFWFRLCRVRKYTISLACVLTDRSGKLGRGEKGWEHWATHKSKWEQWAGAKKITIEFIPWTKSELVDKLTASTDNQD